MATLLASRRLERWEVERLAQRIPPEVLAGFLDRGKLHPCRAALAYVYVQEDKEIGVVRARDDNMHFLLYMTGVRQIRDAVKAAEPYEGVALASHSREGVEEALRRLGVRGRVSWRPGPPCVEDELEAVTLQRLNLLSK